MAWIPEGELITPGAAGPSRPDTLHIKGFWMDKHEVTVGEFHKFCRVTGRIMLPQPVWSKSDSFPVVNVSWQDARDYCAWRGVRLPLESEWEYAALGGLKEHIFPWGRELSHEQANYKGIEGRDTWPGAAPVQSFPPNGFGLYDMAGNAGEWCAPAPPSNPPGDHEILAAARGGSWASERPEELTVTARTLFAPDYRSDQVGFRCATDAAPEPGQGARQGEGAP